MVLIGGGGAANGLNASDASDAETLADIANGQLLALYEFNGTGYTQGGITFSYAGVESYDSTPNRSQVLIESPLAFPNLGFGTPNGHNTITDILVYLDAVPGTPNSGIPIVRWDLAATYYPQGATMTLTWTNWVCITIG